MVKKTKEISLNNQKKKENVKIVRNTAQKTIPFIDLYDNGMMYVEKNLKGKKKFSKGKERFSICFKFSNANYFLLKESEQLKIIKDYQSIFNSLNPSINYQEIYINKPIDVSKVYETVAPSNAPINSEYDKVYYDIQKKYIKGIENVANSKDFYIVLSYEKKSNLDNPYNILIQSYTVISSKLKSIKATVTLLSSVEYLELLHNIYNPFSQDTFVLPQDMYKRGTNIRDYIAPSSFYFKWNKIEMGSCYSRILFIKGYSTEIKDDFITHILDNQYRMTVSKQVEHIDKDIAVKLINNRLKSLESDMQTRKKKNAKDNMDYIPYALKSEIKTCEKLLGSLEKEMELFDVGIYIMLNALSEDDLESITTNIITRCRENLVNIAVATGRQEDALASIVPFANDKLNIKHYLLSDAVGVLLPFSYTSMIDYTGLYYGKNSTSKAPLLLNRRNDKNANCFILGTTGTGKSMYAKMEIEDVKHLLKKDKIIVIDAENEFVLQCEKHKGQVIKLSAKTKNYINPFDVKISKDDDDMRDKADLILTLMGLFKGDSLTAQEKSIIDRCVNKVYKPFIEHDYDNEYIPTFKDFYEILKKEKEVECADLCLYLEMYVIGNCDIFAHKTNVDLTNSYIVFDLFELGANLKKACMFILLDCIWKQALINYEQGVITWLYADEMQEYFDENEGENSSGKFFERIFGRIRKRGGIATGMTQNATRILASSSATGMLQNAQFIIMLEQKQLNLDVLTNLYDLSKDNQNKLKSTEHGEGVLIFKNIAIPFEKRLPKGINYEEDDKEVNIVYKTLTTDFADRQKALKIENKYINCNSECQ